MRFNALELLECYVAMGFCGSRFWELSPKLYLAEMRGAQRRLEREQRDRAWLAWHAAYLQRTKKPVSFAELGIEEKKGLAPKPWKQQYAAWLAYAAYEAQKNCQNL